MLPFSGFKNKPYYESENEMLITLSYSFNDLSNREIKFYNLMEELKDKDPNYQNGYFWGNRIVPNIKNTIYKNLEEAIRVKQELLDDFEEHFHWDMTNPKYAEEKGFLDALKEALSNQESNEQGPDSTTSP